MHILKVTQVYYPFLEKGGPAVKVRAIARALQRRGHRVTVLTADLGLRTRIDLPEAVVQASWGWRAEPDGVETIYLRGVARYRTLTLNPGLTGFCRNRLADFDLVHIYGLYDLLGPGVAFFCRRRGLPYVIEPLGMFRPIDRSFHLKRLWHALLGSVYVRRASALVATSRQEYEELVADGFPGEKVRVRHNGLDLAEFKMLPGRGVFRDRWDIPSSEPLILFLGRLIPRKGVDILLSSFAQACPDRGRLIVAGPEGEPGYVRVLKEMAARLGVENRVLFTGPIFDEHKKAAMVDSDVFVLASSYENFGNAVAESIACGTPVIITERCGISEFVFGQVGLVIPRDVPALARALRTMLGDTAQYKQFKANCARVAAKLDWNRLAAEMEYLYERLRPKDHGQREDILRRASV